MKPISSDALYETDLPEFGSGFGIIFPQNSAPSNSTTTDTALLSIEEIDTFDILWISSFNLGIVHLNQFLLSVGSGGVIIAYLY